MFDNIGGKIKSLAKALMWIAIIGYAIWGIVLFSKEQILSGFLIIAIGSLLSWLSAFVLYGFGQLVENSDYVDDNMKKILRNNEKNNSNSTESDKTSDVKKKTDSEHYWRCGDCGNMVKGDMCPICKK